MVKSHLLGFPRIGLHREMKKAVEAYWAGELDADALQSIGKQIRSANWQQQAKAGLDFLPVGDFSWYDHVLDISCLLGVLPERFGHLDREISLDTYFRMARGRAPTGTDTQACEMTKWFDTNYHYIVPEFTKGQQFKVSSSKLFNEVAEAQQIKSAVKPILLGPLTYLWLGKCKGEPFDCLTLLDKLVPIYQEILDRLYKQGVEWVQLDEPILVLDLPAEWQQAFAKAYEQLSASKVPILLATYFGGLEKNIEIACKLPVKALHIDAVRAPQQVEEVLKMLPRDKILSIGIIDGRNIWRSDFQKALRLLEPIKKKLNDRLWVSCSCSLLHCPIDLNEEKKLDEEFKSWLSFAVQKIDEVVFLAKSLNVSKDDKEKLSKQLAENTTANKVRHSSTRIHNQKVKQRCEALSKNLLHRKSPYGIRSEVQSKIFNLPLLPTTTIGSFPQTKEIRNLHHDYKAKRISTEQYKDMVQGYIVDVIRRQEKMGLDVLVHGEVERNDMVEYFGALLEGFAMTENGWVQSYGSRCVKPPIIYGDVSRPAPMTVEWISFAQSQTKKPVKGMLTGPVTIIRWSFVRDDQPQHETAKQIAFALRDEVLNLEQAGIKIIQIDEPAFREGLPLRKSSWQEYFKWAVDCFRLASSGVKDETQIHTHMCYSEFNQIIEAIAELDADVISIEASRSDMELLKAFEDFHYPNGIGPGVYDIHSPQVPSVDAMVKRLEKASTLIPIRQLWVNPDCGLKTRSWAETETSLKNMVFAAKQLRDRH